MFYEERRGQEDITPIERVAKATKETTVSWFMAPSNTFVLSMVSLAVLVWSNCVAAKIETEIV